MTIKRTFLLTSIHTAIKILAGIIMNKIIAVYLGPSGLAMIGQFQNFTGIVSGIGNASIQTGIVKKTAENDDPEVRKKVWSSALAVSVTFSFVTSLIIFFFADYIAKEFLFESSYTFVIQVFAFSLVFYSLNLYMISILNGLGNIGLYSLINILISIVTLVVVSILTVLYKLNGALLAIILTQSVVFLISYFLIYKKYQNTFYKFVFSNIDIATIKQLLKYGLTSFSSGLTVALMMLISRYLIVNDSSLNEAGFWEALIKIGVYFNMAFALPISIYFLPVFSREKDRVQLGKVLVKCATFFTPIMIALTVTILAMKDIIIQLLFTNEFIVIKDLIWIVLLAEIFKGLAGMITTIFFAKQQFLHSIRNEILWASTFVCGVFILIENYQLKGVAYAYLFSCVIWFLVNVVIFAKLYLTDSFEKAPSS